jgi:hemoglobin
MDDAGIWEVVGEEGFGRLTAAFYRRVKEDALLAPMYPDRDWEGAEDRLRGFLLFRFGGDLAYVEERGHPRLRMRHLPFAIGEAERDRWIELMGEAVRETEVPVEAAQALMSFFAQVADFMRNR